MNDNIISPTLTNGITITAMAAIGLAVIFLIAQVLHIAIPGLSGGNQ